MNGPADGLGLSPVEEDTNRVVDLVAEGERLISVARDSGHGQAVRAVIRQPGQNLILLGLPAGGGLPDHEAPGPASLQCLSGRVVLGAADTSWTLPAGSAHVIPQVTHYVTAEVDSVCVLVVSLPTG